MRIISQDGRLDFPYEKSVVFIPPREKTIVRVQMTGDYETTMMAKYSTEEKAKKAMEMLRSDYKRCIRCHYLMTFQFPEEEELE